MKEVAAKMDEPVAVEIKTFTMYANFRLNDYKYIRADKRAYITKFDEGSGKWPLTVGEQISAIIASITIIVIIIDQHRCHCYHHHHRDHHRSASLSSSIDTIIITIVS